MITQKAKYSVMRRVVVCSFIFSLILCFGAQANAADAPKKLVPLMNQAGVEYASAEAFEMTNSYQDMLSLTLTAPSDGFVVLTGSGYINMSSPDDIGGWATISIGTISGGSNNDNETAVQIPAGTGHNNIYYIPFSITAVVPVTEGDNNLYMVGIRDANAAFSSINANGLKLTALFVKSRL